MISRDEHLNLQLLINLAFNITSPDQTGRSKNKHAVFDSYKQAGASKTPLVILERSN
jgi:hypothetical protein